MEDRETARMRKYGESKTTRIMMATVPHVTSGLVLRKFQADGFLLTLVRVPTSAAGLSRKKPANAETSCDSCSGQNCDERNPLYIGTKIINRSTRIQ